MFWIGAAFFVAVAIGVFFTRRQLAEVQAYAVGASFAPGCVIAESVVLLLLAVVFAVVAYTGVLE